MCRRCRTVGPSRVFFRDGHVWQQSLCPCRPQEPALVAADNRWYLAEVVRAMPDRSPLAHARPPRRGCPHDCGPCAWHASPCQLPVLSIILSLTVQTMTYTGQGGGRFPLARHIPVHEAARIVCRESGGTLQAEDFTTRPSAHPLCYLVGYLLKTGDRPLLFARFAPKEEIRRLLADSYLLRSDGGRLLHRRNQPAVCRGPDRTPSALSQLDFGID